MVATGNCFMHGDNHIHKFAWFNFVAKLTPTILVKHPAIFLDFPLQAKVLGFELIQTY
jgi:hypothetical protein